MPRSIQPPLSRAAQQLVSFGNPAKIAATIQRSVRSVESWRAGAMPSRRNRQHLEAVLGIPQSAWLPAPSPFEAELAGRLASLLAAHLRQHHAELQPPEAV